MAWLVACSVGACGSTETFRLTTSDSNAASVAPAFVVVVTVEGSRVTQNQSTLRDASNTLHYYSSDNLSAFQNCAVATGQVDLDASVHSGTPSLNDCTTYTQSLATTTIIDSLEESHLVTGTIPNLPASGYVYALFFYNPTINLAGSTATAGTTINSGNNCVRLWAAKINGKTLVRAGGGVASPTIDLNTLTCFGIPRP